MPNVSSTGLKGGRSQPRTDRIAENSGLDEEMLRVADRMLIASEHAPRPRKSGDAGSHVSRRNGSVQPMSGWMRIAAPPKPSRLSVTGRLPGTASPTTLTRHTPPKRLSVSPRGQHPRGVLVIGNKRQRAAVPDAFRQTAFGTAPPG
jgi:hypothetical protein